MCSKSDRKTLCACTLGRVWEWNSDKIWIKECVRHWTEKKTSRLWEHKHVETANTEKSSSSLRRVECLTCRVFLISHTGSPSCSVDCRLDISILQWLSGPPTFSPHLWHHPANLQLVSKLSASLLVYSMFTQFFPFRFLLLLRER